MKSRGYPDHVPGAIPVVGGRSGGNCNNEVPTSIGILHFGVDNSEEPIFKGM